MRGASPTKLVLGKPFASLPLGRPPTGGHPRNALGAHGPKDHFSERSDFVRLSLLARVFQSTLSSAVGAPCLSCWLLCAYPKCERLSQKDLFNSPLYSWCREVHSRGWESECTQKEGVCGVCITPNLYNVSNKRKSFESCVRAFP